MKKALALILAAMMIFAFSAACKSDEPEPGGATPSSSSGGGGDNNTPGGGGLDPDTVVELRVLNYIDLSSAGAMEELSLIWDAFTTANPNIKITREDEFEEAYHQSVEAYAAAGTLPDVLYVWPSGRSSTLHTQKLLKDLRPLVNRDGLASSYIPLALEDQLGGYLAMLTQGVTATNTFWANMEVLNDCGLQPAKTYSELVAQVPVLREKGYDTVVMPNQSDWVMQSCLFSLIAGRFCGEDWHQKILDGQAKFTDANFIAALDFVKQMYDDGVLPESSLAMEYGEAPGLYSTNQGAYYIDGDWRVGNFITDTTTGEALIDPSRQNNFSISVFPEIDLPGVQFNRSNTAVLGTGWGINANLEDGSDKLEAAWTLLKWLVGKDSLTLRLRTGGISTPSRTDIDFASLTLEPLQVALANLGGEYDRATVVIDGAFDGTVYTPLNEGLQALGLGTMTSQEVAQITQDAFEAWKAIQ